MTTFEHSTETPDALTTVEVEVDAYTDTVTPVWGTRCDDDGYRDMTAAELGAYVTEHHEAIIEGWLDELVGAEEARVAQSWGA